MTELTDLQFIGNRHTIENIEKVICSFETIEQLIQEIDKDGGIYGKIMALEQEIKKLKDEWLEERDMIIQVARCGVIEEIQKHINAHRSSCAGCQPSLGSLSKDDQDLLELIRRESESVARTTILNMMSNVQIKITENGPWSNLTTVSNPYSGCYTSCYTNSNGSS